MKLEIKTLNNDVFYVECEENESIRDVKRKVAERDDLPEKYQMDLLKFLYSGKVMEDQEMIKTYEIKPDGYLVLIKQTPGKPPPAKRKPIPPFSLTNDLFSPNGFGGFNNPLLASPFSQDPFMQSTIKPHAASYHKAFNANQFNANSYGAYGNSYKPQGGATGGSTDEFKEHSSLATESEPLVGVTELKTVTDLALSSHSLGGAEAVKSSAAMGAFPNAGAFGGMSGFKGGSGFAGGATGGFNQRAGLDGTRGFPQFGQGRSPFGKSNGAMVEKDIEQLMAMGFKRGVAKKALEQGCNHLEVALNMLLGGEIPDVDDDEDEPKVDAPLKLPDIGKQTEKEKPEEKKEEAPLEVVIEQRRAKPRSLVRSPTPSPPRTPSPPLHSELLSGSDSSSTEKADSLSEAHKFDGASSFGGTGAFGQGRGMVDFGSFGGPGAFGGAGGGFGGGGFGKMGGMGGFGRTGGFSQMGGGFGGMGGAGGLGGMGALGSTGSFGGTDGLDDLPSLGHEGFSSSHGLGGGGGGKMKQLAQNLRQNPGQLQMLKHRFADQPEMVQMIENNPQQFISSLENMDDSGGFGGRQEIKVELTNLDKEAISEIEGIGFEHDRVVQAYVLCDRNKEFTVNYLLSNASS